MTPQELAEIDRKVAEAIGLPVRSYVVRYSDGEILYWSEPMMDGERWSPSRDWNDAMLAAEKAGLLEHGILIQPGTVVIHDQWGEQIYHADAETGQLALCEAIINLKGRA